MKKIYNYHTGELINESAASKVRGRLYESFTIQDVLDNARAELHNEVELKKAIFSPTGKPIAIWAFGGTRTANTIAEIFNEAGIEYAFVSERALDQANRSFSIDDEYYHGEDYIVIDEFTYGRIGDVEELIEYAASLDDVQVILLGRVDSENAEELSSEALESLSNFVFTAQYDRQTAVISDDEEEAFESVAEKFAKYRKLYESDDEESSDEASADDEPKDDEDSKDDEPKDDEEGSEDETEDVPMTAIVLTVKKDDIDKCKEELVDAGIPEDAITDIEGEEDDENGKLKIDADYALELKDYLKGKGIDLEEKIGGEIVDDSAEDSEESNDEEGKEEDKDSQEEDDENVDFDTEFGDLFGDDDSSDEA